MLRGRTGRYYRLGFIIPFTVAAIAAPVQMAVGDTLARWVYNNQPAKFAAIELVPTTGSDVPETLLGHENSNGTVTGGIPIPGLASILVGSEHGHEHGGRGPQRVSRPTTSRRSQSRTWCTWRGTSWSGSARCFTLLGGLVRRSPGSSDATSRRRSWFLRIAACTGVLAVICMEAGWVVTEVGRQPWIVYNYMRVEEAATGNTGVWITFFVVVGIYAVVGVTTILVLRGMSRRWRDAGRE